VLKSLHYLSTGIYLSIYLSSKQLEKQTSMMPTEPQNNAYNIAIRRFFIY